jgi:hypothetical protein
MFPPKSKPKKPGGMPNPNDPSMGPGQNDGGDPSMGGIPPGPPASMGPPPGMQDPGMGMDPMMAMLGGLGGGMGAPAPPPFPSGPNGLPVGGSYPEGTDEEMGQVDGSPLLQALMGGGESEEGDPYDVPPDMLGHVVDGGTGDPAMGLDQILQMLALAKAGVGGDTGAQTDLPMQGGMGFGMGQGLGLQGF